MHLYPCDFDKNTIIWPKQQKPIHLKNQVLCINVTIYNQDERPLQWTAFHPQIWSIYQLRRHADRPLVCLKSNCTMCLYWAVFLATHIHLGYLHHTTCGELWWNPSEKRRSPPSYRSPSSSGALSSISSVASVCIFLYFLLKKPN